MSDSANNRAGCPSPEALAAALEAARRAPVPEGGEGPGLPPELEAHLGKCTACRREAAAWALGGAESDAEKVLLNGLALDEDGAAALLAAAAKRAGPGALALSASELAPSSGGARILPLRSRWSLRLSGATVALAAAASLVLVLKPGPSPEELLEPLAREARPALGALSSLPWAPYQATRGARDEAGAATLSRLLAAKEKHTSGAERALAAFYLWRGGAGDAARAEQALRSAPASADVSSDLAALALAQADAVAALDHGLAALALQPAHTGARFNLGLAWGALGMDAQAAAAFGAVAGAGSLWAREAKERAQEQRGWQQPDCSGPATLGDDERLSAVRALFAAGSAEALAAAKATLHSLGGPEWPLGRDLERLAARTDGWSAAQVEAHGVRWARYGALKAEARAGRATRAALAAFADEASSDALLAVPALALAGFDLQQHGEATAAQAVFRRVVELCRAEGCTAESEAIALDELGEAAFHDGDFGEAHRLQDAAEKLLNRTGARLQVAELRGKRAALLAAEDRLPEASAEIALSLQALRTQSYFCVPPAVRAQTLAVAGSLALDGGHARAAAALDQAGLELLKDAPASPVAVRLARLLADARSRLGAPAEARAVLEAERSRQATAGEKRGALELRAQLAFVAEGAGDQAGALAQAEHGLAEAEGVEGLLWTEESAAGLRLIRGRALAASASLVGTTPERAQELRVQAEQELTRVVEVAASAARKDDDAVGGFSLALGGPARGAAIELAALGLLQRRSPAALLEPLELLRAAALRAEPAGEDGTWTRAIPEATCLLAFLPRRQGVLRIALGRDLVEARELPLAADELGSQVQGVQLAHPGAAAPSAAEERLGAALFGELPSACASAKRVLLLAEPPLDRVDLTALPLAGERLGLRAAAAVVSSLGRALAKRPPQGSRSAALLVYGASASDGPLTPALPSVAAEKRALQAAFGQQPLEELTGPGATPTALLARLPEAGLVHVSVHGAAGTRSGGGHLLLSAGPGQEPRLGIERISRARLAPFACVVLASCHAAGAESGLALAFARAGASVVVAAQGEVDDAAVARWAALFYPALARGLSAAEANQAALRGQAGDAVRAWFTVLE